LIQEKKSTSSHLLAACAFLSQRKIIASSSPDAAKSVQKEREAKEMSEYTPV
jgi:hypothetical protein